MSDALLAAYANRRDVIVFLFGVRCLGRARMPLAVFRAHQRGAPCEELVQLQHIAAERGGADRIHRNRQAPRGRLVDARALQLQYAVAFCLHQAAAARRPKPFRLSRKLSL